MSFSDAFDAAPSGNRNPPTGGKPPSGLAGFDDAEAAKPLPPGFYNARIVSGMLTQTKKGEDAYKMTFEVNEGEHRGRRLPRIWTFGERAIGYSKRDLAAFGLTTSKQLLSPFPPVGRETYVRLAVGIQRDNPDFNEIKNIEIIRTEDSPAAAFLIDPDKSEGGIPI